MAPSIRCPTLRQSVALLPEKSLRAIAGPRSPERQCPLLRVAAVPRVVMAQSGVQANGLAKQPLPLADPLADPFLPTFLPTPATFLPTFLFPLLKYLPQEGVFLNVNGDGHLLDLLAYNRMEAPEPCQDHKFGQGIRAAVPPGSQCVPAGAGRPTRILQTAQERE